MNVSVLKTEKRPSWVDQLAAIEVGPEHVKYVDYNTDRKKVAPVISKDFKLKYQDRELKTKKVKISGMDFLAIERVK